MTFLFLLLTFLGVSCAAVWLTSLSRWPAWAVALAAGAAALMAHVAYFDYYTSDDAFISFRYARNWAEGLGPVWNAGERVDGYTNFLWTGLLAAAAKLGLPLPKTASWAGFAAGVGVLGAVIATGRRWPESLPSGMQRWLPLAAILLLVANGAFSAWAYAGLETTLFTALVVLGAYLHLREEDDTTRLPWSGLALLAAALTRPEGVLFFAVTGAFKAFGWWRAGRPSGLLRWIVGWAALFLVPFAVYFAWHWAYYDYPFPNSFYAKVGSGMAQYRRGLNYVAEFGREYGGLLVVFVPVVLVAWPERRRQSAYLITLLLAWAAYVVYIGGDTLVQRRMLVPALPFFYLLAAAGALWLFDAVQARLGRTEAWFLAGAVSVLVLAVTLHPSSTAVWLRSENRAMTDRELIGRWLRANVPEDYTIALSTAGAIPYYSRLPAIDVLGINDRHIAHADIDVGSGAAGHEKFDSDYVLERAPELIIQPNSLEPLPKCLAEDYQEDQDSLIAGDRELVRHPMLFEQYTPQSVEVLPGRWFNVLLRNDAELTAAECGARVVELGQTLTLGELEVTAHAVLDLESEIAASPPPGLAWLAVDVSVTNIGEEQVLVSPFLQTALEDGEANRYLSAVDQPGPRPLEGTVAPGETLRGDIVYAVPADAAGLQFIFSAVGELGRGRWLLD